MNSWRVVRSEAGQGGGRRVVGTNVPPAEEPHHLPGAEGQRDRNSGRRGPLFRGLVCSALARVGTSPLPSIRFGSPPPDRRASTFMPYSEIFPSRVPPRRGGTGGLQPRRIPTRTSMSTPSQQGSTGSVLADELAGPRSAAAGQQTAPSCPPCARRAQRRAGGWLVSATSHARRRRLRCSPPPPPPPASPSLLFSVAAINNRKAVERLPPFDSDGLVRAAAPAGSLSVLDSGGAPASAAMGPGGGEGGGGGTT